MAGFDSGSSGINCATTKAPIDTKLNTRNTLDGFKLAS